MKSILSICGLFLLFLFGCKEKEIEPLVKTNNIPGVVTNVKVENGKGFAKLSYTLPDDLDLLYVQAVYRPNGREEHTVKSSIYSNNLLIEGFADTEDHEVTLYAVNRSENRSAPIKVIVKPLIADVHTTRATLKVEETFGGVNIQFENEEEKEFVVYTLIKDEKGDWLTYDRLYTNAKEKEYAVRGLPAKQTDFAFFFVDKWKNHSDTLKATFTPLFEEYLNKGLFRAMALPTDSSEPEFSSWQMSNLWDNGPPNSIFYQKSSLAKMPNWFTFDLGKRYKLSRIKVNQLAYDNAWMFAAGAPKLFEIYGSNSPNADGSWSNWTLLSTFESKKPSGSGSQLTNEDIAVAKAGEDFPFHPSALPYRYIRFKTLTTWGGSKITMMSELTFWGQEM